LALFGTPPCGAALTERDVQQICFRELPTYNVPQFIEILNCLPFNSGLKIDHDALSIVWR